MFSSEHLQPEEILRQHELKATAQRIAVLSTFLKKDKVLTLAEISKLLGADFDRITLYRTLNAFEENGLIHKIPDKSGNASYALCKHESVAHTHNDNHVHFKCTRCELTVCLEEIAIPEIHVPKPYHAVRFNFLVEGLCEKCIRKN